MSTFYEAIGRLVIALVSRRYRDEIKLLGIGALVVALFAVLWGMRTSGDGKSDFAGLLKADSGRKRRPGAFVSIR